jgi:hypothetical protein
MAEANEVVELEDEVLQFNGRSEAANTLGKVRSDLNTW